MSRVGGGRTHASSVGDSDVARAREGNGDRAWRFIQKMSKERHRRSQTVNVKYFCVYMTETSSHGSRKMHLFYSTFIFINNTNK